MFVGVCLFVCIGYASCRRWKDAIEFASGNTTVSGYEESSYATACVSNTNKGEHVPPSLTSYHWHALTCQIVTIINAYAPFSPPQIQCIVPSPQTGGPLHAEERCPMGQAGSN
jgi:hypothetical protein